MHKLRALLIASTVLAALGAAPGVSAAAESYDSCVGFIDTVPTVISTQGTWCLRQDLTSSSTSINAITIQTNHVTIDCNGFKLGNLAAGPATNSTGVFAASNLSNITVRNCAIQGFFYGIFIGGQPGTGHVVEDNRLWQNRDYAITVNGYSSIVRRNIVSNTGGGPGATSAFGINVLGGVNIIDNVVDGISGDSAVPNFVAFGINAGTVSGVNAVGLLIRGNRVRNLIGNNGAYGIDVSTGLVGVSVRDNVVAQPAMTSGYGIYCAAEARLRDNLIKNYSLGLGTCDNDGGNVVY